MREIFIKYNPYKVETTVTIDGNPVKKNSALNVEDRRLQEWVEDLPRILVDECNTKSFCITFQGTILDYEDMLSVINEAKMNGFEFECKYIPAKEVKDKEQAIADIFEEIQAGPFEELKQPDVLKAFKIAQSSEFPVNVVATMSAGKSTLINALLRQKLMPAKQEACTATITELKDSDDEIFHATVYDKNGELIETHPELTLSVMEKLNVNPNVSVIRAEGDIPFVNSDDVSLVLVDTPGPNNSRDPEHKAATYRMLSESSKTLVIYILNATQLAVNDDNNLLNHVADSMRVGGKQSKDRFIFVVNKLDDFKQGEDSVNDAIQKVRKYLEDKGIHNPNIYPASALTALDIRTILKNMKVVGYTEDELDEIDPEVHGVISKVKKINRNPDLHLEQYAPLTPSVRGKISADLADAEQLASKDNDDAFSRSEGMKQLALIHSGVVPIEAAIQMYVLKYAKTAKIKNIVDTFSKKLESQRSFENTRKEIAINKDKQQEILEQIDSIQSKLKNGEDAKKFKEKIDAINYDKEIRQIANSVIKDAQTKIEEQISSNDAKLSRRDAESICHVFGKFAESLQAEVQVKLEELVSNHIEQNAKELLQQYKQRISDLSKELNIGGINVNAFEMLNGDIDALSDISSMVESVTKTERVAVGTHREKNTDKKWYKPWTWLQDSYYEVTDYANKEYVEGTELAKKFFAPIQERLYNNSDSAVNYAKEQARMIKDGFKAKFNELDSVLKAKLRDLEICATDKKNVEKIIVETQQRLEWLENIQKKIKNILDI